LYLYYYFELWTTHVEKEHGYEHLVSSKRFVTDLAPMMSKWGLSIPDAQLMYQDLCDKYGTSNTGGMPHFNDVFEYTLRNTHNPDGGQTTTVTTTTIVRGKRRRVLTQEEMNLTVEEVWAQIRLRLPREKTQSQLVERRKLFAKFDVDGRKYLSIEDALDGCINLLDLDRLTDALPSIVARAHAHARIARHQIDRARRTRFGVNDAFIEFFEFRLFLIFLYNYFELWMVFKKIDPVHRRVTAEEFKKAVPLIERLGVRVPDTDKAFASMDKDRTGYVDFDEFAEWTTRQIADDD